MIVGEKGGLVGVLFKVCLKKCKSYPRDFILIKYFDKIDKIRVVCRTNGMGGV